jgi:lysophospholipase L1-like esterase
MLPQLIFIIGGILIIPIVPLLIWQGKRVKNTIPNLPEAIGTKGQVVGNEKIINLLTIGESTFAGVGVLTHEEGVTGQLAQFLSEKTNCSVNWEVVAQSGYTAKKVLTALVPMIPKTPIDIVVIGLGGNDTFELNFPMRWQKDLIDIISEIQKIQPESSIVIATLPPVGSFPAFPFPVNAVLGGLERLHSWAVKPIPEMFQNVYFDNKRFEVTEPKIMFSDGVHPSGYTYSLWGKQLAEFIVTNNLIQPLKI